MYCPSRLLTHIYILFFYHIHIFLLSIPTTDILRHSPPPSPDSPPRPPSPVPSFPLATRVRLYLLPWLTAWHQTLTACYWPSWPCQRGYALLPVSNELLLFPRLWTLSLRLVKWAWIDDDGRGEPGCWFDGFQWCVCGLKKEKNRMQGVTLVRICVCEVICGC